MTRWIVFDVGGVLVDEARVWRGWAELVGLSEQAFRAALGAGIRAGKGIGGTVRELAPGLDIRAHRQRLAELEIPREEDLYPDVRQALAELRAAGFAIGIAGNQPEGVAEALTALDLGANFVATSAQWGISKPEAGFFARVTEAAQAPSERIVYVGDRLDNDVAPARAAGMRPLFLPRGPWGEAHDETPHVAERVESLLDIRAALG
ncbi:HAD family hydrolase [Roseococcus suduntuyensis]|uniref:HAD superfamily hydrolase (TIGR01549 family) n=1 Tax=Roseococcus suduntuyensis TaxID=455361 RepID=A0A840A6T9_9PROT|nr:HAD family hydrolase [Roseococcus suduntuyensis]MBB3897229.1 HAD superfamily hydrolase (TIGR01549 family) [Roseococcus suduntuyensis]